MRKWKLKLSVHQWLFVFVICGLIGVSSASAGYNYAVSADTKLAANPDQKIVWIIPHTHYDPWWLDPFHTEVERWCANVRNALDLMKIEPTMCFVPDQVVGIKYLWENYPEYRSDILQYIKEGRLEIVQGFVSQPDENLVGELGLIEDALQGITWVHDVLHANVTTGWELDPFGFGAGTPTFYNDLGLKYCVVMRTSWMGQDGVFNWTGNDGSSIYGYKIPNYSSTWGDDGFTTDAKIQNLDDFIQNVHNWIDPSTNPFQHTVDPGNVSSDLGDQMIFYGSDFTNPTNDLPGYVAAWNAEEAARTGYVCKIGTPKMFFDRLGSLLAKGGVVKTHITPAQDLNPTFSGCYTSRVDMKNFTLYIEQKLTTLETIGSIAKQLFPNFTYPEPDFETAWFKASAMHHHDTVTGSSTQPVFLDTMQTEYQEMSLLDQLQASILGTFVNQITITYKNNTAKPVVLFNPLGWNRMEPVEITVNNTMFPASIQNKIEDVAVIDPDNGSTIPSQVVPIENMTSNPTALKTFDIVFVGNVPSMGYKTYLLQPLVAPQTNTTTLVYTNTTNTFTMQNAYYNVQFNMTGKNELSIYDKTMHWQVLNETGTPWQLLEYADHGDNYGYDFTGIEKNVSTLVPRVVVVEQGPARVHVKLEYTVGTSTFNRSILLSNGVKRVDFQDEMNFQASNTSVAFRFAFNVTNPTQQYDEPFGFTNHAQDNVFYPALYDVTEKNATNAVSLVNYGIHGYRSVGSQLEGVLVRNLNNTGTGTNVILDHGYFDFNYCLTTFAPNDPLQAGAIAQQKLDYAWNFPVTVAYGNLTGNRPLPSNASFYQASSPAILMLGLRKVLRQNAFNIICTNVLNQPVDARITTTLPIAYGSNASLIDDPIVTLPVSGGGFDAKFTPFSWQNFMLSDPSVDDNGPVIGAITTPDTWTGNSFTLTATITDAEGSAIAGAWLQYCFNNTFDGQAWTSIPMQSTGNGQYQATFSLANATQRPIYLRVLAIDVKNNTQVSEYMTVIDQPAFTGAETTTTVLVFAAIAVLIFCILGFAVKAMEKKKARMPPSSTDSRTKASRLFIDGTRWFILQVLVPALVPLLVIGTWVSAWVVQQGYFGAPGITSLNPGYDRPAGGVSFPWSETRQNNLYTFFSPTFFLGNLVTGFVAAIIVLSLPKAVSQRGRVFAALVGAVLVPFSIYLICPVLFIVGSAPASYWQEIAAIPGLLYNAGLVKLFYWYLIPIFCSAIAAFFIVSFARWTWFKVLPGTARDRMIAGARSLARQMMDRVGSVIARNKQYVKEVSYSKEVPEES